MQRINYRCVESLNIGVEVAKCGKFSHIHPVHPLLCVIQNNLSWHKNPFMASFQLIGMSPYAKNKQKMCRVTQHQCNVAKCWKYSQIYTVHWLFHHYINPFFMTEQYIHVMFQTKSDVSYVKNKLFHSFGVTFNSLECRHDVENIHKFTHL